MTILIFVSCYIYTINIIIIISVQSQPALLTLILYLCLMHLAVLHGSSNFQRVRQFVLDFVQGLEIGPNDTQVGVIVFSSYPTVVFNLNTYSSKDSVLNAVRNIAYTGGGTNTYAALNRLLSQGFTTRWGARLSDGSVSRLAVVMTDGRSNSYSLTLLAARRVHSFVPSIIVYAIGVTSSINRLELNAIASQPSYVNMNRLDKKKPILWPIQCHVLSKAN